MPRRQRIPSGSRLRDCTDGRGRPIPAATRSRFTRRAPRFASTSRVRRDTKETHGRISVVIADRNPTFLRGLASVLQTEGDFVVVASCQNEVECIVALRALSPSLALLDVSLSDLSGPLVLAVIRTEAIPTRVVFLSSSASATDAARAFSMGASGVLPKDGAPQSLIRWLRQVRSGQLRLPLAVRNAQRSRGRGRREDPVIAITARERQIMELVSTGLSNREVGKRLHISEGTIKVHLHHIFQKLSIRNRTALANITRLRPHNE